MLETEDRPVGTEPAPTRRSPARWLLVAAAVAVIAIVGALLVATGGDDEDGLDTVTPTPPTDIMERSESGGPILEPGTYFIDPDGDPSTPLRVTYEITASGWEPWIGAMNHNDSGGHVGLSITTITNLVRDACRDQRPAFPAVGPSVDDLATALTQLAPFEVSSPPSDVTILGYHGKHLQLTVPQLAISPAAPLPNGKQGFTDCTNGELKSWIAPLLGGAFWGYNQEVGHNEEFWILDVDGTRLVIQANQSPDSPAETIAELEAIFDSIRIEP
jgi:hypothetical protein